MQKADFFSLECLFAEPVESVCQAGIWEKENRIFAPLLSSILSLFSCSRSTPFQTSSFGSSAATNDSPTREQATADSIGDIDWNSLSSSKNILLLETKVFRNVTCERFSVNLSFDRSEFPRGSCSTRWSRRRGAWSAGRSRGSSSRWAEEKRFLYLTLICNWGTGGKKCLSCPWQWN